MAKERRVYRVWFETQPDFGYEYWAVLAKDANEARSKAKRQIPIGLITVGPEGSQRYSEESLGVGLVQTGLRILKAEVLDESTWRQGRLVPEDLEPVRSFMRKVASRLWYDPQARKSALGRAPEGSDEFRSAYQALLNSSEYDEADALLRDWASRPEVMAFAVEVEGEFYPDICFSSAEKKLADEYYPRK